MTIKACSLKVPFSFSCRLYSMSCHVLCERCNVRQMLKYLVVIAVGILLGRYSWISVDENRWRVTLPTTTNEIPATSLILSTAIGMPLLNIYRFIRTARATCNTCRLVIFTTDVNNEDYQQLARLYDVVFLSYDEYRVKEMKNLAIYSMRFLIYHRYLSNQPHDRIFICDLRDTLFQKNIFDSMKPHPNVQLFFFMESKQLTIGECKVHNQWISSCYGRDILQPIYNLSRSCAGSILGTYKGIRRTAVFEMPGTRVKFSSSRHDAIPLADVRSDQRQTGMQRSRCS